MKEALFTALEPLLLTRAGALARALTGEQRAEVERLAAATAARVRVARDLREPELVPAALCLGREALALSVSALLAARGRSRGKALPPAEAWAALRELAEQGELALPESSSLGVLMTSDDPAHADALDPDARRRTQDELDTLLDAVRARYEPRTGRQLAVQRGLRVGALLLLLTLAALAVVTSKASP